MSLTKKTTEYLIVGVVAILLVATIVVFALLRTNGPREVIASVITVSPTEFSDKIAGRQERQLIDIRTPEEYQAGHLSGAANIDFYDPSFVSQLESLDRTQPIAIYCRSGSRTSQALVMMEQMGFTDVIELSGGVLAWQDEFGVDICTQGIC